MMPDFIWYISTPCSASDGVACENLKRSIESFWWSEHFLGPNYVYFISFYHRVCTGVSSRLLGRYWIDLFERLNSFMQPEVKTSPCNSSLVRGQETCKPGLHAPMKRTSSSSSHPLHLILYQAKRFPMHPTRKLLHTTYWKKVLKFVCLDCFFEMISTLCLDMVCRTLDIKIDKLSDDVECLLCMNQSQNMTVF